MKRKGRRVVSLRGGANLTLRTRDLAGVPCTATGSQSTVQPGGEKPKMRVQDEEALKIILESYLEENALFMLKTDRQTFLSRILSVSEDEIVVSSPVED